MSYICHVKRALRMIWRTNVTSIVALLILCLCASHVEARDVCIVCDTPVTKNGTQVTYRGVSHPLHTGNCLNEWERAIQEGRLDAIVIKVEPRGALFQGDSKFLNPDFQKAYPISSRWLWFGIWLMVAIVSGGCSAALAIVSHRSGIFAFVVGFLLPGLGILVIKILPKKLGKFELRGTKIATTHDESYCPQCNHPRHPSAESCIGCGASLTPKFGSEVSKVRK